MYLVTLLLRAFIQPRGLDFQQKLLWICTRSWADLICIWACIPKAVRTYTSAEAITWWRIATAIETSCEHDSRQADLLWKRNHKRLRRPPVLVLSPRVIVVWRLCPIILWLVRPSANTRTAEQHAGLLVLILKICGGTAVLTWQK